MMDGVEFINATDGKQYYIESFLKAIVYGYRSLIESKGSYSREEIHNKIKEIQKSDKAHNEIEDYLCGDLVNNYVKPNLRLFGLDGIVVNTGVRETKNLVTVGHLDIKFQLPSLAENHYYAFEAKRLDINKRKQNYYISGGIERFTSRTYYPETNVTVAGMIGFVEVDKITPKNKVSLDKIKDSLNEKIATNKNVVTTQKLSDFCVIDLNHSFIQDFKYLYLSKHTRDDDGVELQIFHIFLDYYDILKN